MTTLLMSDDLKIKYTVILFGFLLNKKKIKAYYIIYIL